MIDLLRIKNFQSHQATELELCPGVNVIVGPSDNGKSSVLRALHWVVQNKPDGVGFVSHWNLTPKGYVKDETRVTVVSGDHAVTRIRHKDTNAYIVDGKTLEAFGKDVPEEVPAALHIDDVNIQRQLDPHFLLSDSAGEVARIFNRTIRLDDIDKLLSLVESKKRSTRGVLEQTEREIERDRGEVESLSWVDDVQELVEKAQVLEERVVVRRREHDLLLQASRAFDQARNIFESIDTSYAEKMMQLLEDALHDQGGLRERYRDLGASAQAFLVLSSDVERMGKIPDVSEMIDRAEKKTAEVLELKRQSRVLGTSLADYAHAAAAVRSVMQDLTTLSASLPDLCPMCAGTGHLKDVADVT